MGPKKRQLKQEQNQRGKTFPGCWKDKTVLRAADLWINTGYKEESSSEWKWRFYKEMGGREGEMKKRMQIQKHIQAKTRLEWNEANNWAGQGSFLLVFHHLAKIYFLALIDNTPHNRRTTEQSLLASPTTSSMLCKRAIPCRKFWKTGEAISLSNPCVLSCLTYASQKIYFFAIK